MTRLRAPLNAVSLVLVAMAIGVSAAIYARLPHLVPSHFNLHGQVDGWLPRAVGALLLPGIAGVVLAVVHLATRGRRAEAVVAIDAVLFLVTALLVALHGVVLGAALFPAVNPAGPLVAVLCVFWGALSLLLPRLRRNPLAGIRTPWTLASDEVWARTHRFAGQLGFVAAVLAGAAALAGLPALAIATIILSALLPAAYSYWIARDPDPSRPA